MPPQQTLRSPRLHHGALSSEDWPPMLDDSQQAVDTYMDVDRLQAVWSGAIDDDYAAAAITGTLGVALRSMGMADTVNTALETAKTMWSHRDKARLSV
jgi:hypothetical protein